MKVTITSMKRWLASLFLILSLQAATILDLSAEIHRSSKARHDFMKQTGHPKGWKGHIVDHVRPLCSGGRDVPANMAWSERADSLLKDREERILCLEIRRGVIAPDLSDDALCVVLERGQWPLLTKALCAGRKHAEIGRAS